MRAPFVIAGLLALSLGSAPALAFQEMPEPPPADIPGGVPQSEALQLGTPGVGVPAPQEKQGGINVFGYTLLPKLDLGLDVLYGQDQQRLELQGPDTLEENDDVTVLGRVKRRF
jgi:hypothetical protein